jgi:hypothetical protein
MTQSLEQRIKTLEAIQACEELRSKYCWYAVRGDAQSIGKLFSEDCSFERPAQTPDGERNWVHGRAALLEMQMAISKPLAVLPLAVNHVIDVQGDEATGTCAMQSALSPVMGGVPIVCYYIDKFGVRDGEWLFTQRRLFYYRPFFENPDDAQVSPTGV